VCIFFTVTLYAKKFASQGIKVINATTALEGEENIPFAKLPFDR
jgi:hypothetical protein